MQGIPGKQLAKIKSKRCMEKFLSSIPTEHFTWIDKADTIANVCLVKDSR